MHVLNPVQAETQSLQFVECVAWRKSNRRKDLATYSVVALKSHFRRPVLRVVVVASGLGEAHAVSQMAVGCFVGCPVELRLRSGHCVVVVGAGSQNQTAGVRLSSWLTALGHWVHVWQNRYYAKSFICSIPESVTCKVQ